MINSDPINETELAISLLREQLEVIRINFGIIELLRQHGRIMESDKQFIEICELDRNSRQAFQDFILRDLPVLFKADHHPENLTLKRFFLDWANDLHVRLTFLDRLVKDYLSRINLADEGKEQSNTVGQIRDKRFWSYLAENPVRLNEEHEPVKGETQQHGKEE